MKRKKANALAEVKNKANAQKQEEENKKQEEFKTKRPYKKD
jgi:hypothetical protein